MLYFNENGYALACLKQNLAIVNKVMKITKEEALEKYGKDIENADSVHLPLSELVNMVENENK